MDRRRLFLAIQPSEAVRAAVAEAARGALAAPAETGVPDGDNNDTRRAIRLIPQQNLHLTLLFLGDTPAERIASIREALAPRIEPYSGFALQTADFGCFPSPKRPRVVWIGLYDKDAVLGALHAEVCAALTAAGFAVDKRAFRAHITVGYVRRASGDTARAVAGFVGRASAALSDNRPLFNARRLILMESRLLPGGAQHQALWSLEFLGK